MQQVEILSVPHILESCIEREKLSVELYERALHILDNPASLKLVERFKADELDHIRKLKSALDFGRVDRLGNEKTTPQDSAKVPREPLALSANATPRELYALAISHEEKSMDYYARYVDAFRGTELGDLFDRLRREEEVHRAKLIEELNKTAIRR